MTEFYRRKRRKRRDRFGQLSSFECLGVDVDLELVNLSKQQGNNMSSRLATCLTVVVTAATSVCSFAASSGVSTGKVARAIYSPRPEYPFEARRQRMTGSGLFVCRIDIKSGLVKKVMIAKSTGHTMLDNEVITALQKWRFQPGKLRPIREIWPNVKDQFRDEDSLAKVPVTFTIGRSPVRR